MSHTNAKMIVAPRNDFIFACSANWNNTVWSIFRSISSSLIYDEGKQGWIRKRKQWSYCSGWCHWNKSARTRQIFDFWREIKLQRVIGGSLSGSLTSCFVWVSFASTMMMMLLPFAVLFLLPPQYKHQCRFLLHHQLLLTVCHSKKTSDSGKWISRSTWWISLIMHYLRIFATTKSSMTHRENMTFDIMRTSQAWSSMKPIMSFLQRPPILPRTISGLLYGRL